MPLEHYLLLHCTATLASIKTGSLFRYLGPADEAFWAQVDHWDASLQGKGIHLRVLRTGPESALVYVYRPAQLEADLQDPAAAAFLHGLGYESLTPDGALAQLAQRLAGCDGFPHEIGLFLGYPLEDVTGFIENGGRNCKQVGCWKVYGDLQQAEKTFARYRRCKEVYTRRWRAGMRLEDLTVAV